MSPKKASSKQAVELPAGQSMSRMRADPAPSGAWTGPVASAVQVAEVVSAAACCAMAEPPPSSDEYQLTRIDATAGPATRAATVAVYQAPPSTGTTWWSHFVESVLDSRQAAKLPRAALTFEATSPPNFAQPTGFPPETCSKSPLARRPPNPALPGRAVGVEVGSMVGVRVGVASFGGVEVRVGVGVRVSVGSFGGVGVFVGVAVRVGVGEGAAVGVEVGGAVVGVAVGSGEGVGAGAVS